MKKRLFNLILILMLPFILAGCHSDTIYPAGQIFALNTVIDVTFYNEPDYKTHFKEIKKIYQAVDSVSSDFDEAFNNDGVYDLNKNRTITASPILIDLCQEALSLMEETKGYFNPFIGRLSHIWKDAISKKTIPSALVIEKELDIMNNTSLKIEGSTLTLIGDGNLDLGGIAKGYATMKAKNYLVEHNVRGYLVDAGNSNIICGTKFNDDFNIGIADPNTSKSLGKIKGQNLDIGTSSYEHQGVAINGRVFHHIISPFTGYPENYYDSLTVIANDSLRADAYSTALFSVPLEKLKNINLPIAIVKDGSIIYTNTSLVI